VGTREPGDNSALEDEGSAARAHAASQGLRAEMAGRCGLQCPTGRALKVKHTYEPERPDRVFDILREAGIVALNAGAGAEADDAEADAVR